MTQMILEAAFTLIAGFIIARVGLYYFFRQKEYELVKQRYLEQGVDVIASELEQVANSFSHNWSKSLDAIKTYRELPNEFDANESVRGFINRAGTDFHRIANHRVSRLLGSSLVWSVYQLAIARHTSMDSKVTFEVIKSIALHKDGKMPNVTRQDLIDELVVAIRDLNNDSDHFATLIEVLQSIASELEAHPPRLKELDSFRKRPAVVAGLEKLHEVYGAELASITARNASKSA